MKRLIELPGNDRLMARAHALIDAMGRTPESEERSLRVRRSLDTAGRGAAPRWVWRGALAFGLVGVSAVAAASGSVWWRPPSAARAPVAGVASVTPPVAPKLAASRSVAAAPPAVAATPPAVPTPTDAIVVTSAPPRRAAPPVTAAPLSDVARVHEAAKALRHDADPERALQLLEPPGSRITGPLAEEALALRIEASAARGDGRRAKLAAAYLAQYPKGRYKELATKALAGKK
jgi:hypothetical protein